MENIHEKLVEIFRISDEYLKHSYFDIDEHYTRFVNFWHTRFYDNKYPFVSRTNADFSYEEMCVPVKPNRPSVFASYYDFSDNSYNILFR